MDGAASALAPRAALRACLGGGSFRLLPPGDRATGGEAARTRRETGGRGPEDTVSGAGGMAAVLPRNRHRDSHDHRHRALWLRALSLTAWAHGVSGSRSQ